MVGCYCVEVKIIEKFWGEWFFFDELEVVLIEYKFVILVLVYVEILMGVC